MGVDSLYFPDVTRIEVLEDPQVKQCIFPDGLTIVVPASQNCPVNSVEVKHESWRDREPLL